jgi:hypothetical protein
MARIRCLVGILLLTLLAGTPGAWGEWSDDPAVNLVLADRTDGQVQPKLAPTADGGFYVSWFDNSSGGYDVYLQRLDSAGNEVWAHNGVLVADRGFSSTQDYGLSVDTAGNALLAFNDDRGPNEAVTVARVSSAGDLLWGTAGIQVASSGTLFFGPPAVAGTSDGNIVVAWSQDDVIVVQKLDGSGAPQWGAGVTLVPASGSYFVADLRAADNASAILSFVTFSSRHLMAQKLAADGSLLWGAGHVAVFDGGTLQYGNFPPFVLDGAGGAVFAWYSSSPSLQCRVQRVLANGSEAFTHNGVETSTAGTRLRVGPSAAFVASTQEVFVFWTEENSTQSQNGLYGQKISSTGARQWTDSGLQLVALGANQISNVTTLTFDAEAVVAWAESLSYGNDRLHAWRVDGAGGTVWTAELATTATGHSRLEGRLSSEGYAAYVWERGDSATADVVAQNLNPDGSLGHLVPVELQSFTIR